MWSGSHGSDEGLLVPWLFDQGVIAEKTFSFYLAHSVGVDEYSGASYIDFGAPNESLFGGVEPLWLPV